MLYPFGQPGSWQCICVIPLALYPTLRTTPLSAITETTYQKKCWNLLYRNLVHLSVSATAYYVMVADIPYLDWHVTICNAVKRMCSSGLQALFFFFFARFFYKWRFILTLENRYPILATYFHSLLALVNTRPGWPFIAYFGISPIYPAPLFSKWILKPGRKDGMTPYQKHCFFFQVPRFCLNVLLNKILNEGI